VSSKVTAKVSTPEEIANRKADMAHHQSKSAGAASRASRDLDGDSIPF